MEELFWRSFLQRWVQQPDFMTLDPAQIASGLADRQCAVCRRAPAMVRRAGRRAGLRLAVYPHPQPVGADHRACRHQRHAWRVCGGYRQVEFLVRHIPGTFRARPNHLFAVIASAVAFSHEAEGRGGKQSRMPAVSTNSGSPWPLGLRDDETGVWGNSVRFGRVHFVPFALSLSKGSPSTSSGRTAWG